MTLDDLERQNRGFYKFFVDFELQDTFQERIAPKSIETAIEKLRMKFSALDVNFDGLTLDFLCSRKPVHEGIKEWCPHKSRYFTVVGQSFVANIWVFKIDFYDLQLQRAVQECVQECDKMAGDRLTVCEQEML